LPLWFLLFAFWLSWQAAAIGVTYSGCYAVEVFQPICRCKLNARVGKLSSKWI